MTRKLPPQIVPFAWLACGLIAGCMGSPDEESPSADVEHRSSKLVVEGTDWSGRLHIQIVDCFTTQARQHQNLSCDVDPSFVLVGGGARTFYSNAGALLTESRPFDNGQFRTWSGSSKDHIVGDAHHLQVFAVGMRLDGVPRSTLVGQMQIRSATSGSAPGSFGFQTSTDEGFALIGGGARVNWSGQGSLLTRSSPFASQADNRTWVASVKDHIEASSASLTVFAIGIRPVIPGFGTLEFGTRFNGMSVSPRQIGQSTTFADNGWVTACPGALADWSPGEGRLLFGIVPQLTSAYGLDKDHHRPDAGTLVSYVRQIRVQP